MFVSIDSCTIAINAHSSGSVIQTALELNLTNSIIDQPDWPTLSTTGTPRITVHGLLAANSTGLLAEPDIVFDTAFFVDTTLRNYHQVATKMIESGATFISSSPGIDFAASAGGTDLDGKPRDQDVPELPDRLGVRDLGCYEEQPIPRIFADAFGDPVSLVQ